MSTSQDASEKFFERILRNAFDIYDTNRTGALDHKQVVQLLNDMCYSLDQPKMKPPQIKEAKDIIDPDGDGEVTFDELKENVGALNDLLMGNNPNTTLDVKEGDTSQIDNPNFIKGLGKKISLIEKLKRSKEKQDQEYKHQNKGFVIEADTGVSTVMAKAKKEKTESCIDISQLINTVTTEIKLPDSETSVQAKVLDNSKVQYVKSSSNVFLNKLDEKSCKSILTPGERAIQLEERDAGYTSTKKDKKSKLLKKRSMSLDENWIESVNKEDMCQTNSFMIKRGTNVSVKSTAFRLAHKKPINQKTGLQFNTTLDYFNKPIGHGKNDEPHNNVIDDFIRYINTFADDRKLSELKSYMKVYVEEIDKSKFFNNLSLEEFSSIVQSAKIEKDRFTNLIVEYEFFLNHASQHIKLKQLEREDVPDMLNNFDQSMPNIAEKSNLIMNAKITWNLDRTKQNPYKNEPFKLMSPKIGKNNIGIPYSKDFKVLS